MIFHETMPYFPWMEPNLARLPGVQPMQGADFLRQDEVFAGQMALRDSLILQNPSAVHGLLDKARFAAAELYDIVLKEISLNPAYHIGTNTVRRPDGVLVDLNPDAPLLTLGRLVQEDLCILQNDTDEHVLTAAILCFPASWTLDQKLGRPMGRIHKPVHSYTPDMAARVHRMMEVIRPGHGLWRMNFLTYADPSLHHPRTEDAPRDKSDNIDKPFVRCERQSFIRLPETLAVVFTIHTYLMRRSDLPEAARFALQSAEASPKI